MDMIWIRKVYCPGDRVEVLRVAQSKKEFGRIIREWQGGYIVLKIDKGKVLVIDKNGNKSVVLKRNVRFVRIVKI